MADELLPEYEYAVETTLHLRCTSCGQWWTIGDGRWNRDYWCPWCGLKLAPAQYADAVARPATTKELEL